MMENTTMSCDPIRLYPIIPFGVVAAIQIVMNGFPLLSLLFFGSSASRLNSIYVYVKNVLAVNLVMAVFALYTTIELAFVNEGPVSSSGQPQDSHRYNQSNANHVSIMRWWAFRKGFIVCLFVLMCSNVAVLIYGLKDRFIVAQKVQFNDSLSPKARNKYSGNKQITSQNSITDRRKNKFKRPGIKLKKHKAYIYVVVTWTITIGVSITSGLTWNCISACQCLPSYYDDNNCRSTDELSCSSFWQPTIFSFALFTFLFWGVSVLFIVAAVAQSISQLRRQKRPRLFNRSIDFQTSSVREISFQPRGSLLNISTVDNGGRKLSSIQRTLSEVNILDRKNSTTNALSPDGLPVGIEDFGFVPPPRSGKTTNIALARQTSQQACHGTSPKSSQKLSYNSGLKRSASLPELISETPKDEIKTGRKKSFFQSVKAPRLHPSLKLAIILSITVMISTAPISLYYFVDAKLERAEHDGVGIDAVLFVFLFVYGLSCPVFLIKYLAGLKKSVIDLCLWCSIRKKRNKN